MPAVLIVLILAIFSLPLVAVMGSTIQALAPLFYIAGGVLGVKFLMDHSHKNKMALLDKQKEIQLLELQSLQEAEILIENSETSKNSSDSQKTD